ncbi:RHS domain-containing protein, partial [Escherichia coli]|nr:type IV secretion protein Rhs [Escherichia coli]EJB4976607.1 RHS domain-containing protein [Escherichia coli]
DVNGAPEEMTDSDGKIVWETGYQVWGNTIQEKDHGGVEQNLRYQGQYLDRETGLHYNLHRYYDPDVGRFMVTDPIGLAGGINLYQYAPNPLSWIDPLGLLAGCWRNKLRKIDDAVKTPGNAGLKMTLSRREANRLGKEFVGEGYSVVRGKKGELWYISADGKRMYRSPTPKSSDYAKTGKQANFHERRNVNDNWWDTQRVSNVHVHVE